VLDLAPKGRDEAGLGYSMEWLERHDAPRAACFGLEYPPAAAPSSGRRAGYGYPDTLTLIQAQLREVGIDVEQVLLEEAAIWGRLAAGEHTVFAMGNPHSNPDEILMFYFHSRNRPTPNRFGFNDPKVDALLDEGRTNPDKKRLQEIYGEVQKKVIESAVWVPLWHPGRAMIMSARVTDLRPHAVYDVGYHKLVDVSIAP
jgi:ABC-type transport system substrate-binding protein